MAWMDHYEAAALRKGRALEDLFGPEYGDAFSDPEVEIDGDGWEHRGDPERGAGYYYLVRHRGDFEAYVVPLDLEYEVFARGPGGISSGRHQIIRSEREAKDYALELMYVVMARALEGAKA